MVAMEGEQDLFKGQSKHQKATKFDKLLESDCDEMIAKAYFVFSCMIESP